MAVHKALKKAIAYFTCLLLLLSFSFVETRAEASVFLVPSLTVSDEYNDNFFFTSVDREEDLLFLISPALTLKIENSSIILAANYVGGAELHVNKDERNGYRQDLTFNIELPSLSRKIVGMEVHVTEALVFSPEIPSTAVGGSASRATTSVPSIGRGNNYRNMASIGMSYTWSPRWLASFNYLNTIAQFEGDPLLHEDLIAHTIDIGSTYNYSHTTKLIVEYGILITRPEVTDGFTERRVSFGGEHHIDPTLIIREKLGGSFLRENAKIFVSEIGLEKKIEMAHTSLRYVRNITTGAGAAPAATLSQTVSAEAGYAVNARTAVVLKMDRTQTNALLGADIKTVLSGANMIATCSFLKWLTGSASYAYFDRSGAGISDGYSNRVAFFLTASDPGWRFLK